MKQTVESTVYRASVSLWLVEVYRDPMKEICKYDLLLLQGL